jgi:hypothetical protein
MTRHLVDELVFDIAIDSRSPAMCDEAWLSRLVTGTLLPVVEQVFDAMDDGDTVLVLPSLDIDLGDIVQAEYEETAARRLRAGLEDALQRALAEARRARGAGAVAAGASRDEGAPRLVGRDEAALARLAHFLATGTMPWHAGTGQAPLHEALLVRLLARGGAGLWTVLARALADPRSARRLAGQFPERQLLAVLRAAAGAHAPAFETLLAQLKRRRPGAGPAQAAWVQVLTVCTADLAQADVPAACARIRAALAPSAGAARAAARADIDLLARFLDSGLMDQAPDGADMPAHQALLARLLRRGGDSLRALLAHPHSARQLAEQFRGDQLPALLEQAKGWTDGAATVGVPEPAPSSLPDTDALALFLDSGVLRLAVEGADMPAHQALLARLLLGGGDSLRALLARALAHPHSARRLAEQFPGDQLQAVLRFAAGADTWNVEALLETAKGWPEGAATAAVLEQAWSRVRAGHTGHLDSGVLPVAVESADLPAHQALLDRLLERGGDSLRALLARALAHPHGARRLAEQFPAEQLLAALRLLADADAGAVEALLVQAKGWTDGAAAAGALEQPASAPVRAMRYVRTAGRRAQALAGLPATQRTYPRAQELAALAAFLDSGAPHLALDGAGSPTHQALFDRMLERGGDALRPLLARALAQPRNARRFVERFSKQQQLAVFRRMAGGQAAWFESLLEESARADGSAPAAIRAEVLAAGAAAGDAAAARAACARIRTAHSGGTAPSGPAPELLLGRLLAHGDAGLWPVSSRALAHPRSARRLAEEFPDHQLQAVLRQAAPADASHPSRGGSRDRTAPHRMPQRLSAHGAPALPQAPSLTTDAVLRRLTDFLGGATLPPAPGVPAPEALLGRLLADDAGAHWPALACTLAEPACARRFVDHFPGHQVRAVMARLAPAQTGQLAALLTRDGRDAGGRHAGRPARNGDAAGAADRGQGQGAPSSRTRLRDFSVFLESGRLPLAAAGDGAQQLHEALLDDVLERADDALWRIVADALEHEGSAARLLTQFPQRQLFSLCARSAPGYAPALERLVRRLAGTHPDQADLFLRHVLAACVARPAHKAWPATVYAKAALALNGAASPSASIAYTCRRQAPRAGEAVTWRASRAERGAARALVRLAAMTAQWRARIDAAGPAATTPEAMAAPAACGPGLVLRERENMARLLNAECPLLEALLAADTAGPDAPGAARSDDLATLRTAVAAHLGANRAIAPQRQHLLRAAIQDGLDKAADPAAFLRGVLAALTEGSPLDLDALAAQAAPNAAAPETPARLLAAALKAGDAAGMNAHWQALLGSHGAPLLAGVRHYCRNAGLRRAVADALPDALFFDLAGRLDPAAPAILRSLLTPSARLQDAVGGGSAWTAWTVRCRDRALAALAGAAPGVRGMQAHAFLRALMPPDDKRYAGLLDALPAQFAPGAGAAAQGERALAPAAPRRAAAVPAALAPMPADSTELLVVGNAGMVLAAPYLPRLFAGLGLTADGAFVDKTAAGRAVHLVQFMVTGQAQTPEYELVLNKILCGLPTATPIPAGIDITQAEQDTIEGMVRAMVAHAKVLGSSSVAAMRQTFFARAGDLQLIDEAWQLRVHPGTFDMLLDRLPWSYSLIKLGWMARPLHVTWRPT